MNWARRVPALLLVTCLGASTIPVSSAQLTTSEVKAAFLYNFARFTEWPAGAFTSAASPLVIGIAGDEELRQTVDGVVAGKLVAGRPVETRQVNVTGDLAGIHMLFVSDKAGRILVELLAALERRPVLTVGDGQRFSKNGGMIEFLLEGNRLRFDVSIGTAEHAGLRLSSRVLALAKSIHGKS